MVCRIANYKKQTTMKKIMMTLTAVLCCASDEFMLKE